MGSPQFSLPIVLKFGGTSVGTPERIRNVARIIQGHRRAFEKVVVVVSAMGDTTDELIELATKVSPRARLPEHRREMDMLLTAGERISMSLVSMALGDLGVAAISLTGSQTGIVTDTVHGEARIFDIKPIRLPDIFAQGKVAIVAGFQGVSLQKEITTLGRGGSDTSAVALACALGASEARIFTDVDGVRSADPRLVPDAKFWPALEWDVTIEAAYRGAQVLHPRCVELGRAFSMPIRVLSSFQDPSTLDYAAPGGTLIYGESMNQSLEGPQVKIIAHKKGVVEVERACATSAEALQFLQGMREKAINFNWFTINGQRVTGVLTEEEFAALPRAHGLAVSAGPYHLVSFLGVGLSTAYGLSQSIWDLCAKRGAIPMEISSSPQAITLKLSNGAPVESLLPELHALAGVKP